MHTYPCVPGISKRHKGTLQRCPIMVSHHRGKKKPHTHSRTCILVHTQVPAQSKGKHTPKVLTGDLPSPCHPGHQKVLCRVVNS